MGILYFDGYCNLCNWFIDFLIRRDTRQALRFTSLQGKTARDRLPAKYVGENIYTIVFEAEGGKIYTESAAALRALARLGGVWRMMLVVLIVPWFLRDLVYRLVAVNRYRLFGRRETCRLPSPEERARFLD